MKVSSNQLVELFAICGLTIGGIVAFLSGDTVTGAILFFFIWIIALANT